MSVSTLVVLLILEFNDSTLELLALNKAFLPMTATQVGADVFITASLCWVLHGRRSEFQRTNSIINTLMIYAINRCLLTATAALVDLLAVVLQPNSMWYVGAEFTIVGLYTNAFLASLNSRRRMREGVTGSLDYQLSNLRFQSDLSTPEFPRPVPVFGSPNTVWWFWGKMALWSGSG
ncbi:hypothetical protein B0H17DRAFT_1134557 [Mycena rosella]|uniref:DUF6534 domain-containing protein n=1 Tax=Mycena rosella TaxID=1033263 RepID=A0AAD7DFF9_MYCRO|nr:hypothetical protein B0H17DRAFT_1134557 [Mycena rosella]